MGEEADRIAELEARVAELEAENLRLQRDADDAHMTAAQHAEELAKSSEAVRGLAEQARSAEAQLAKLRDTIREGLATNAIAQRDLKPENWWLYAQKDDQGIDLEGDFFVVLGPWNGKELPVRYPDLGNGFGLRRNLTEDELRRYAPDALARASVHRTHQQEAERQAAGGRA